MSTEQPPSIAPQRPAGLPPVRPAGAVGRTATPTGQAPAESSFGDRIRKAAGSAKEAVGRSSAERPEQDVRDESGPRRVRLSLSWIDPWSVMKLSFLLSVAIGIMIVIAAAVVWSTLNNLEVFTQLNDMIRTLSGQADYSLVLEYASFDRVISLATMVAVVDVVLLTALSTIMAFLYNIVASLVGGLHVTLTDD